MKTAPTPEHGPAIRLRHGAGAVPGHGPALLTWPQTKPASDRLFLRRPRECTDGTAKTFKRARADFERAWRVFLSNRTEADFQAWRDQRDWTAEKYRRFNRGERMPPDWKPERHASG